MPTIKAGSYVHHGSLLRLIATAEPSGGYIMSSGIACEELRAAITSSAPPTVIDVRRQAAFRSATDIVAGALRRDPETVSRWVRDLPAAGAVVVYCAHGGDVSQGVAKALKDAGVKTRYLEGGIEGWKQNHGALDRKPSGASTRWVTRARPKIDRIACPWLIARFIDADAEFLYVPAHEVVDTAKQAEAIPYDVPGVAMSHVGELCSFDAFLKKYHLTDPALRQLAGIVRGADTSRLDLTPQSAGLYALSLGLSANFADDHEMLAHGKVMYDALYSWCKACQAETHN